MVNPIEPHKDSVMIIAAEASSSLYAQRLLELWQREKRPLDTFGIGSREMEKLGFKCLGRSEEMAVVGVQEVLKHLPMIRAVYKDLLAEARARKPRFALLMDYPDFNLRLAHDLKALGIKVIYYISPQVWAWRTGRVKKIKRVVDRMLVLFPFEQPFYQSHGVPVDFVGHPLLDELPDTQDEGLRKRARARFGLGEDDLVLGLMPGSRRSEIHHHLQTQLATARILVRTNPRIRPVLLVAPTLERDEIARALTDIDFPMQIVKESPIEMIRLADAILVASGTATLMVGLMEVPMVIMYRMNPITAWLARRLVTKTRFFGMVNLILDKLAVPELFQGEANPDRLALEIRRQLENPDERNRVKADLKRLRERLGMKGATVNVARILGEELRSLDASKEAIL